MNGTQSYFTKPRGGTAEGDLPFCETNTYSWTRFSRRTRVTRETNWTLQREKEDIPKSERLHLENCRALVPATPATTRGVTLRSKTPIPYPQTQSQISHPIFASSVISSCHSHQFRSASRLRKVPEATLGVSSSFS